MISSLLPNEVRPSTSPTEIPLEANISPVENISFAQGSFEHWASFIDEYESTSPDILRYRDEHFGSVIRGNIIPITAANNLRSSFEDSFLVSRLDGYEIREVRLVNEYIGRNPDLLNFLQLINGRLLSLESIDKVALAFYKDAEEGWAKLHVQAYSDLDSIEEIIQLEKFLFIELFVESAQTFSNRIVFSVV